MSSCIRGALLASLLLGACALDPTTPTSGAPRDLASDVTREIDRPAHRARKHRESVTVAHRDALAPSIGSAPGATAPTAFRVAGADTLGIYTVPGDATAADFASSSGGGVMSDADVQLVFWGNEWTGTLTPSAAQIQSGIGSMLATPYLDRVKQYGTGGLGLRGGLIVHDNPPAIFNHDDLDNLIWDLIDAGNFPEPDEDGGNILYAVVAPPSSTWFDSNTRGAHSGFGDYDFPGGWTYAIGAFSNFGSVDFVTDVLSHEFVEAMTDPYVDPSSVQMNRTLNGGTEIGDACNNTVDRIDGVLVQAYFSQIDHACVIPFPAGPTISSIFPSPGARTGGDLVDIYGTGFETGGHTTVTFGGVPVALTCASATHCSARAPAGNGAVDVVVTRNRMTTATSDATKFYYTPTITSITPANGKAGDIITIKGIGLTSGAGSTQFLFGTAPASSFNCFPGPDCTAVVPPGAGTVDVTAAVAGQTSAHLPADRFTYAPVGISHIEPDTGSLAGGTTVLLSGNGFDPSLGGTRVYFNGVASPSVSCNSTSSCFARSPAGATLGPVHITFSAFGVTSPATPADLFQYVQTQLRSMMIAGGSASVVLNGYAPAGGFSVHFTSSDPTAVTVPSTLVIPAGYGGGDVPLTLLPVDFTETLTISAMDGSFTVSSPITVTPWYPVSIKLAASTLAAGASMPVTLILASAAPPGGAAVTVTSSDPSAISVPATVTVPTGSHQVTFTVTNVYGGAPKRVSLSSTYAGYTASASVAVPSTTCVVKTCSKGYYWNPSTCSCKYGLPS